jgi:putative heme iron utilization protein
MHGLRANRPAARAASRLSHKAELPDDRRRAALVAERVTAADAAASRVTPNGSETESAKASKKLADIRREYFANAVSQHDQDWVAASRGR